MPVEVATDPMFGPMKQMNKVMEQMQKGFYGFFPNDAWAPAVNLYETAHSYLVCVDLAGVVKEEIDLQVHDARLVLRGRRAVPVKSGTRAARGSSPDGVPPATPPAHGDSEPEGPPPRYKVHLMEIDHGQFVREVELPQNVQQERINATYRNGLLWIELPKQA